MNRSLTAIVTAFACGFPVLAQTPPELPGPYAVGSRSVGVAGIPGGNGTVALLVRYPSTVPGLNAPLLVTATPCPVVVFGHGFSLSADLYETLYQHWASYGFLVVGVATEQGLFTGNLPKFIADFQAAVLGIRAAAATSGHPLFGAVAPDVRAISSGHSFGGAAAIVAASSRPDLFLSVASMAATATSPQGVNIMAAVASLAVPALHLGASSDVIVPPAQNLNLIYAATPPTRLLVEIAGGTHSYFHEAWGIDRLAEPPGQISVAQQQLLVRRYTTPFFEWTAVGDPGLSARAKTLSIPVLFDSGPATPGTIYTVYPTWEPGDPAVLAYSTFAPPAPLSSPYGLIHVDPATAVIIGLGPAGASGFVAVSVLVPAGGPLQGVTIVSQSLMVHGSAALLSNPLFTQVP